MSEPNIVRWSRRAHDVIHPSREDRSWIPPNLFVPRQPCPYPTCTQGLIKVSCD